MFAVDEIADQVFRISLYVPDFDLQFNHFLVRDEEPLLYHAGMRGMFPVLREAVGTLIDPADLRWISGSHFEVDEWGALNEWLEVAPQATAVGGVLGTMVNLMDFANRPPQGLGPDQALETGACRFRFVPTPHLPHGWDAVALFEESGSTLFCSDLFHQVGEREALTEDSLIERTHEAMINYQAGPLMDYMPYMPKTRGYFEKLAALRPQTLATMHGSSFRGDGAQALMDLDATMKEVFGQA